ncbi:Os11g0417300, partial [Oryza sativa Japonica Group]
GVERGERGTQADLAGGDLVVCVTCKCGVHKEFGFDHSH